MEGSNSRHVNSPQSDMYDLMKNQFESHKNFYVCGQMILQSILEGRGTCLSR